ncbi:hypothetical protein GBF38_006968 [Nibea albiflora]|uniref:Uncharacterized protein n=1 Tax=Nibea albiflora TaxID=240163 RepID=A0ACB7EGL6_NIBAL|nr:hypothetical protein GBF38_006968 [Nibea albiflora]
MESNIPRLLLILIFSVLPAPLYAETSVQKISKVVQVYHLLTWQEAEGYCRAYHTDLVTIRNTEEANNLTSFGGWIGLRMSWHGWTWSQNDEKASFLFWNSSQPGYGICALKYWSSPKWFSSDCKSLNTFLCVDENMILVQEMKTWEEALLHCRELPSALNNLYYNDLACLPESCNLVWNREKIPETVTDEVWIGLRFLAGHWVWTNGGTMESSYLPQCPAQDQHCGALDRNNDQWKTLNCNEKRHFLCSLELTRESKP